MKSRIAVSALFTLIAASSVASHPNALQQIKGLPCRILSAASEHTAGSSAVPTIITSPSSPAGRLQRAVLNLIDHEGE